MNSGWMGGASKKYVQQRTQQKYRELWTRIFFCHKGYLLYYIKVVNKNYYYYYYYYYYRLVGIVVIMSDY